MKFKFEKLIIWQNSMTFAEDLNTLAYSFPKMEIFNLCSQIRRASDSIALNISEGSICQSNKEFRRFLNYSIRSVSEVITCLYKAKNRNYISQSEFDKQYHFGFNLMNMIIGFRNKIIV